MEGQVLLEDPSQIPHYLSQQLKLLRFLSTFPPQFFLSSRDSGVSEALKRVDKISFYVSR